MKRFNNILYTTSISGITYSLSGDEDIERDAVVTITSPDSIKNGQPYPGGINDVHLGTNTRLYKCHTCFNNKEICMGHEGVFNLNYPVWNPISIAEARKWIRLTCHACGQPVYDMNDILKVPIEYRLDKLSKISKTHKICPNPHCRQIHPTFPKNDDHPLLVKIETFDGIKTEIKYLYPHDCALIFGRIQDDTIRLFGRSPKSGPHNFILHRVRIPAVNMRPDIKKMSSGHSAHDSLTTLFSSFIKLNEEIKTVPAVIDDPKVAKLLMSLSDAYYDIIKAGGKSEVTSIAASIKGKFGLIRKHQLGKRVRIACRSVIVGDSRLDLDEVLVPLSFATTIQIREIVQSYNRERLNNYVQNGRNKKYPGASSINKRDGRKITILSANEIDLELENGDEVYRDVIDGDIANFNRAPSLNFSSITAMRVRINRDPSVKVLAFNVLITPLFNADFDGDCMSLYFSNTEDTMFEIGELANPGNWFVSLASASTFLGQKEDSIVSMFELTRSKVLLDKYHALLLFSNVNELPDFSDVNTITGRDCVSELLRSTPINYTGGTTWYGSGSYGAAIKYDPTETNVVIDQGRLKQGILDKKTLGKGADNAIYHLIASDYNPQKALRVMFDMQQMAINYALQTGYTVGILDMLIPLASKQQIDDINSGFIRKSQLWTERLHRGDIIPPIGKTVGEHYEEQQQEILKIADEFRDVVLRAIDPENNNLFKLSASGSKGSFSNINNMVSAGGQKFINGLRAKDNFSFKRTTPYSTRFDPNPRYRGYVMNSYLTGMDMIEYYFTAAACRFDLISKALMTAITGEQNRKSIKSLESIVVDIFRRICKHKSIVSLAYGDDMYDPRKLERVKFPTVMISDEEFAKYKHPSFPQFFEDMKRDRDEYRRLFLKFESMNLSESISADRKVGVDVGRLITDVLRANEHLKSDVPSFPSTGENEHLAKMVEIVNSELKRFPYLLMNETQEKRNAPIPPYVDRATWLIRMLIRTHLCPTNLVAKGITEPLLRMIIDKIRIKYRIALVEPGIAAGIISALSFCEPLTQYMLDAHTRSAVGGTSKSGVRQCKDIFGARSADKVFMPSMLLTPINEYSYNKAKVQEIANKIEVMELRRFIQEPGVYVFIEKFGEPSHPDHIQDKKMISNFKLLHPLLTIPSNLIPWCLKFLIDRSALILKNMSLELIVSRIRETHPECFVVNSPENAKEIVVRIYFRGSDPMFKSGVTQSLMESLIQEIIKINIRGVEGITSAKVVELIRNKVNDKGAIVKDDESPDRESKTRGKFGIQTVGTNLVGTWSIPEIDARLSLTTAIQEIASIYGIEAARNKIISELKSVGLTIDPRHYMMYADEMTRTGIVTAIENAGLKYRESNNVLLLAGFSSPMTALTSAALNNTKEEIYGVTSKLMIGDVPEIGTAYHKYIINTKFVQENTKSTEEYLQALL